MREEIFEGKNEEEALLKASEVLGCNTSEIEYEVLERKTGIFGLASRSVKIKVRVPEKPKRDVDLGDSEFADLEEDTDEIPRIPAPSVKKGPQAQAVVEGLLKRMGVSASIDVTEDDDAVYVSINSHDRDLLIGRDGEVLASLQFLVNKMVNRFPEDRKRVVVDAGGFKQRREESLKKLAMRLADKAISTSRIVRLRGMNARDRRFVHMALKDFKGVTTKSEGEGINRALLIVPDNFVEPVRSPSRLNMRQGRRPRQGRGRGRTG